jgi:tetratricopeptide (TPR) repeat protein
VASGASLLERVGGDPRLRTLYLNNVGSFHIRRHEPEAARRVLEQALEVGSSLGPDEPSRVQTLGNLAIAEERAGLDEPARTHLAEGLALARRILGPHHPTVAELARLRGELLLRTGHLRAAEAALREVLELLRAAVDPRSPLHHAPLVLLGELALEERRYAEAEAWFQQAVALELAAEGGGEMYGMLEETGLARAWWGQGEPERAREVLERMVARAEASGAPYTAALRELYGRTLLLHGQPAAALLQLRRTVELQEQQGNARSRLAAVAVIGQGRALGRLGRLDEAEAALDEALPRLEGMVHRRERAWALVGRSRVAAAKGQRAPAIAHARAAVALLEPWGEPEHPDHALAWGALARALRMGTPTAEDLREAEGLAKQASASLSARGEAFGAELAALEGDGPTEL